VHELSHEFTSRKVSPWGGIKYFHKTYQHIGLQEYLSSLDLPEPGSNRGYNPVDIIEGFMVSVVLGSRRLAHTSVLRMDEVIKEIFGWQKGMGSASTFSRFFKKFTVERNNSVFPSLMKFWFDQMSIKKMTVDIDSTVIPRYGKQELVAKGYNPQKRGRGSHHPLIAFNDEMKMVINAWMRSGDSNSGTDAIEFLQETFSIVGRARIDLLRGDVGFYSQHIFNMLEEEDENPVSYIIRARMTRRLLRQILELDGWHANDTVFRGACYNELQYQGQEWKKARRIIVVRTPKKNEEQGGSHLLFKQDEDLDRYEYKAYTTNTDYSAVRVHQSYNQRADSENRIKELKYDYGIDGFALHSFGAMEAAFRFIMIAYNIMSLFRQKVMVSRIGHRLSTIKFQCIAIGSYLVKNGRNKKLKLSAEGKRKHFLEHFFSNLELLHPPFEFSNA